MPTVGDEPVDESPEWSHPYLLGYERYLSAERNLSPHTVRAYVSDAGALFHHVQLTGVFRPVDIELAHLRSWLAAMAGSGLSRTTIARRAASARALTGWLFRQGHIGSDCG